MTARPSAKVWMVTGAGRGLGLELTRELLARGHSVAATARQPHALRELFPAEAGTGQLLPVGLDVDDPVGCMGVEPVEARARHDECTLGR